MDRCATCKHWDRSDEYTPGHSLGLGNCRRVRMFWDATEWADDDFDGRRLKPSATTTTAFTQDASDYKAYLLTKPEHGCTQHKPV